VRQVRNGACRSRTGLLRAAGKVLIARLSRAYLSLVGSKSLQHN